MRLLVGLGNPGAEYAKSRHNIGFDLIDALVKHLSLGNPRSFKGGDLWEAMLDGEKVLLFKPMQYMNRSGLPVRQLAEYFDIAPEDICIAADDVYVAPGSVRIRKGGGDGGHNGWKSVLEHLKSDAFWRVRIGVGIYEQHPEKRQHQPALDEYVLQPMPAHERKLAMELIDKILPNLIYWLEHGELSAETIHL